MIHLLHVDTFRLTEAQKLIQSNVLQPLLREATAKGGNGGVFI